MCKQTLLKRAILCLAIGAIPVLMILTVAHPASAGSTAPPQLIVDKDGDDGGGDNCAELVAGDCSLRSAILTATTGASSYFEIVFDGNRTITLSSSLPELVSDTLTIRAMPGQVVKINGNSASENVFRISGSFVKLEGLRIYGSGSLFSNIWIRGPAQSIEIANNVIGDDDPASGGCGDSPNSYSGIYINASGPVDPGGARAWVYGNVIECHQGTPGNGIDLVGTDRVLIGIDLSGNAGAAQRNIIRLNDSDGVYVSGPLAANNTIANSYIGVNDSGTAAAGNGLTGITVRGLANNAVITGNLISGNAWAGVWISNSQSITLTANTIGTNAAGTAAIPNGQDGVAITDGAQTNLIGGATADKRNVIGGNTFCGVRLRDGASRNRLDFNWIGLNAAGSAAIPNQLAGVCVFNNSNDNTIGSSLGSASQYISGNSREGVYIENSSDNFVGPTNRIGVAADGTTPLGNGLQGVMLNGATNTSVFAASVRYNGAAGVAVIGSSAAGNYVSPGTIHTNGGLPIDLGNDGATANDAGDGDSGPNTLLNSPSVTAFSGSIITGTACANCKVHVYQAIGNPASPGGGGIYHTSATADASGNWSATLSGGLTRLNVGLVACALPCFFIGNTSEMSPRPQIFLPAVLKNN